jgi:hypothetical protein
MAFRSQQKEHRQRAAKTPSRLTPKTFEFIPPNDAHQIELVKISSN